MMNISEEHNFSTTAPISNEAEIDPKLSGMLKQLDDAFPSPSKSQQSILGVGVGILGGMALLALAPMSVGALPILAVGLGMGLLAVAGQNISLNKQKSSAKKELMKEYVKEEYSVKEQKQIKNIKDKVVAQKQGIKVDQGKKKDQELLKTDLSKKVKKSKNEVKSVMTKSNSMPNLSANTKNQNSLVNGKLQLSDFITPTKKLNSNATKGKVTEATKKSTLKRSKSMPNF